ELSGSVHLQPERPTVISVLIEEMRLYVGEDVEVERTYRLARHLHKGQQAALISRCCRLFLCANDDDPVLRVQGIASRHHRASLAELERAAGVVVTPGLFHVKFHRRSVGEAAVFGACNTTDECALMALTITTLEGGHAHC